MLGKTWVSSLNLPIESFHPIFSNEEKLVSNSALFSLILLIVALFLDTLPSIKSVVDKLYLPWTLI